MVFNISSLADRHFDRIDTDRKIERKEKTDKNVKNEQTADIGENEKTAVDSFERVEKTEKTDQKTGISSKNEQKLSDKAKDMLEKLRDKYGDLDIFVGNTDDELEALSQYGNKQFSVIFSNAELEKMADEEEYANSEISSMESALEEAKGIADKLFADGDRTQVNSFSIAFNDDGTQKLFASLQRKPETTLEKTAENKYISLYDTYVKGTGDSVKRTVVSAANADELLEKIQNVNWDEIEESKNGDKYDFSV